MIYADESFYTDQYLLGRKPVVSTGFLYYARQASRIMDQYTFNRLADVLEDEIPEEVKMCCCELAESVYRYEKQKSESEGKTSEKIGTYSVTFGTMQETADSAAKEQGKIIRRWLGNTGLCYRGCGHVY